MFQKSLREKKQNEGKIFQPIKLRKASNLLLKIFWPYKSIEERIKKKMGKGLD
jgi:hypothetical protein